jgi:prepilin-type N-terminal cleavage/methylation domain-containing protein/prepilin-type processing-associated H-X9-DG protein
VPKRKAEGFTLIELLAAIAIVSLLGAVSIPSLKQAKQVARVSICASNLRIVGIANAMYMSHWEDYLVPYSEWNPAAEPGRPADWYVRYALVAVWQAPMDPLRDTDGFLSPYLPANRRKVAERGMGCPAVPPGPERSSHYVHHGRRLIRWRYRVKSYAHNYHFTTWPSWDDNVRYPVHYSRIPRPADLVHLCDSSAVDVLIYPVDFISFYGGWPNYTADIPEARHDDEFNMVFVDGHVDAGTLEGRFGHQHFSTKYWGG